MRNADPSFRRLPTRPCRYCYGSGVEQDPRAVGEEMRRLRQQAGISQRQMASVLQFTPSYLCDLELGRRPWSLDKFKAYRTYLDGRPKKGPRS